VGAFLQTQDYLLVDPTSVALPVWIFNYHVGELSPWRHVPMQVLPPICVSSDIGGVAIKTSTVAEYEIVAKSAVRIGVSLIKAQIKSLMVELNINMLTRGSGKRGSVVKKDLAKAVVLNLFPDESPQEHKRMIAAMCSMKTVEVNDDCPETLLKTMCSLDVNNADHFKKVKAYAVDQMEKLAAQRKHKEPQGAKPAPPPPDAPPADAPPADALPGVGAPGPHALPIHRLQNQTPPEFRKLLPGGGHLQHLYLKVMQVTADKQRVQVEFAKASDLH
jgi:hypothetical protein